VAFDFTMAEVISLLPITQSEFGKGSYNIRCPNGCDAKKQKDKDGHLNINLHKGIFCCPKCNFGGGILDFYSFFANVDRRQAKRDIEERLKIGNKHTNIQVRRTMNIPKEPEIKEYPLNDIDARHATYTALLNKLSLASDHMGNLLNRGLTEQVITEKQYRTTPVVAAKAIARQLQEEGFYLTGVPGFYRDADGAWSFAINKRGILVPVRDMSGRIQGLQVRCDDVKRRKFRWISSAERPDGCKAECWTHIAGPIRGTMLLIEGPMKADVVNYHTGQSVIAIPGVNSLKDLEKVLKSLKELGVKHIMTCLDMDSLKNPNVNKAYFKMLWLLNDLGFSFGTYLWHPEYNGLDDYVWKYCLSRKHSG